MAKKYRKVASSRTRKLAGSVDQIIKEAASMLDEELSAGILAAQRVEKRFRKEGRCDEAAFKQVVDKFQNDARDVVGVLSERLKALRSPHTQQIAERFVKHAHSALDLFVEMISMGADLADQLAQATKAKQPKRRARK